MSSLERRVAAIAMTAVVATACSAPAPEPDEGPDAGGGPDALTAEICSLATTAADEPQAAGDGFATEVHDPLHDLIDELLQEDRAAASRLLRDKSAVESLARQSSPKGTELQEALRNLAERIPGSSGCPDG